MTYFITAPLLYKEAVIGSLESFFYGFDASHKVTKNGHAPDRLGRSIQHHSGDDQVANIGLDNPTIDSIHKRALLKLVTAVHIVHNPKDGSMYRDTQSMEVNDLDDIFDDLVQKVDVSRHTNIPKSVKDSDPARVLPNLQRATVGLWCRNGQDQSDPFCPSPPHSNDASYDYHCHLASEMYQFTPGIVCRTPWDSSFLSLYPVVWGDIKINIQHEADLCNYGSRLVPDATNYVHIDIDARSYGFTQHILIRYEHMVKAMASWPDEQKVSNLKIQGTEVIFVVHHPFKREYDKGEEAMRRWYKSIKDYETELRAYITNHDPYPEERAVLEGWDNWKIIPEEEYPFCPACQPEEYRNHQNSRTVASPPSA
jgi:hypothetical protein